MKLFFAAVLSVLVAGCAATGTQVSQSAALQFKEGITSEADIVAKLGAPTGIRVSSGGIRIITYTGGQAQVKGASFIPIIGMFAGGTDYTVTTATYQMGADGLLQKIDYSSSAGSTGMGRSPAPIAPSEPMAIK